jgi:hypothetical protein
LLIAFLLTKLTKERASATYGVSSQINWDFEVNLGGEFPFGEIAEAGFQTVRKRVAVDLSPCAGLG